MKIIIPVGSLHLGGGCRVLVATANGLQDKGHNVEVLIPEGKPIAYPLKCKVTRVPSIDSKYIPSADVILTNYYTTVMPAFQSSPGRCVRLSLGFEPLWSNDIEGTLDTYVLPIPILSISKWHHDEILHHTGKESTIVNPGIDLSTFHPQATPKTSNQVKKILFIARNHNQNYGFKGMKDFESAMRLVQQQTQIPFEIQLLCPEGEHHLHGLPVKKISRCTDKNIANIYRDSDIFVSASWFESFGYPALEAMACGTSVITTDSGGVRDFATHNETCLMVPPKDPEALATAILSVIKDGETKRFIAMRKKALQKAREFTWNRYVSQLEKALKEICKSRPLQIPPVFLDHFPIRNYECGRIMAQMEHLPHAVDFPADIPLEQLIRDSATNYLRTSTMRTISVKDLENEIIEALHTKKGFSFISIGDTECAFLGINRHVVEPYFTLPDKGFINAGYDPTRKEDERKELVGAIKAADVVGVPLFRHGLIQKPLMHSLSNQGIELTKLRWSDSTATYKLMDNGALKRILEKDSLIVLCIGNESSRLYSYLKSHGITVSGFISPVQGVKDVARVIQQASKITFDIALVAAGAASIPICSWLARSHQKVALDIGKVADEWVTGITTLSGKKNHNSIANYNSFSEHQKSFILDFQSGYQQGLNELIPTDTSLPFGSLPQQWIRRYINNTLHYRTQKLLNSLNPMTNNTTIKNPIWLKQRIVDAVKNSTSLSVVNLDHRKLSKLKIPYYASDEQLKNSLKQIDIVGIPYLNDPKSVQRILDDQLVVSKTVWVDENTIQHLQFDYFGRFLPTLLKNKRLLLIIRDPTLVSSFLQAKGYTVWGHIDPIVGRKKVLKELQGVKRFDVALVSADIDTLIYSHFIANNMGKVSLDVGAMLHDARRGCINIAMWTDQSIQKMD